MFFAIFNGINTEDLGIKIVERYNLPIPKKRYIEHQPSNINGLLYEDTNTVEDMEIVVAFNFMYKDNLLYMKRKIKNWLLKVTDNKLIFSDNPEYYYRVKKLDYEDIERSMNIGVFEVTFTVECFEYLLDGSREQLISNGATIINDGEIAKPIIRLVGEGLFTINFNDKKFTINVGQEVIIDGEEELCYRDGKVVTSIMTGDFPVLNFGENKITWTGNIREFWITTNIREL